MPGRVRLPVLQRQVVAEPLTVVQQVEQQQSFWNDFVNKGATVRVSAGSCGSIGNSFAIATQSYTEPE